MSYNSEQKSQTCAMRSPHCSYNWERNSASTSRSWGVRCRRRGWLHIVCLSRGRFPTCLQPQPFLRSQDQLFGYPINHLVGPFPSGIASVQPPRSTAPVKDKDHLFAVLILKVAQILTCPFFYPGRWATIGYVMIADLENPGLVAHRSLLPLRHGWFRCQSACHRRAASQWRNPSGSAASTVRLGPSTTLRPFYVSQGRAQDQLTTSLGDGAGGDDQTRVQVGGNQRVILTRS
jgi:hypothetical protein